MSNSSDDRISRGELTRALRLATEMQARRPSDEELSLAEAEQIASEVGVDPSEIRAAIASVRSMQLGGSGLLGPYGVLAGESTIPRAVGSDEVMRMLASADVLVAAPTARVDSAGEGLWRMTDGRSSIQVSTSARGTRISAASDRRGMKLGLVGGGPVIGSLVGVFLGAGVAMTAVGSVDAMVAGQMIGLIGGGAGGLVAGIASWKGAAARTRERVLGALERMRAAADG